MKIAWFTPFSRTSAIGQCSSIIVERLAQLAEVTVYVSDVIDPQETWLPGLPQVSLKSLALPEILSSLTVFDMVIYNLGDNSRLHSNIFAVSRRYPGIVILHDLVMQHFFSGYYFAELKDRDGYVQELALAHGEEGRRLGQKIAKDQIPNVWESEVMLQFHMAKAAVHGSLGVVTHSEFARREVETFAAYPVSHIDFPTPKMRFNVESQAHADGKVHFLSFGMLNRNKLIDRVIESINAVPALRERVIYDVIGRGYDQEYISSLQRLVEKHQLQQIVHLHGYQPDEVLHRYMSAADVIVNLRNPHFGEASWVLLEAAFSGKPTVVWKHGYYDEYPDNTVVKVTDDTLRSSLERVATDDQLRQQLSKNILQYAQKTFVTERYCQQLLRFIDDARGQKPFLLLTDTLSRHIQEIDRENLDLIRLVASEISQLLPK